MRQIDRHSLGGSLPLGFLGMVALVVAIERYAVRGAILVPNRDFGGIGWKNTPSGIKHKTLGREILCFGDSFVNLGVVPAVLHQETGKSAYNLAIQTGSAPSSFFLLRRAVEEGARPSIIIGDFDRGILQDHPASKKRPYPWAELLSLRDALELGWIARDGNLFAEILTKQAIRSWNTRLEIRRRILDALRGETGRDDVGILAAWRNANRNEGANLFDKNPRFQDAAVIPDSEKALPGTWVSDGVNATYVERFLGLAGRIQARVYWLLPPASPGWQSIARHLGDEDRYLSFIRRMQQRYPHVVVLDGRYSGFKADVFLDGFHLDREGAAALSAAIGGVIRNPGSGASLDSRWINLPKYAVPSHPIPMEVFSESLSIARGRGPAHSTVK